MDDILKHYGFDTGQYTFKDSSVADKATDVLNTLLTNTCRALRLVYDTVEEVRKEHFPPQASSGHSLQVRRFWLDDIHMRCRHSK